MFFKVIVFFESVSVFICVSIFVLFIKSTKFLPRFNIESSILLRTNFFVGVKYRSVSGSIAVDGEL